MREMWTLENRIDFEVSKGSCKIERYQGQGTLTENESRHLLWEKCEHSKIGSISRCQMDPAN